MTYSANKYAGNDKEYSSNDYDTSRDRGIIQGNLMENRNLQQAIAPERRGWNILPTERNDGWNPERDVLETKYSIEKAAADEMRKNEERRKKINRF